MPKFILIFSLLFLASCTTAPGTPSGKTPSGSTPTITQPVKSDPQPTPVATISAPTYGSGSKKVEYYADFQCPACINFSKTLLPIIESFVASGKLQLTHKQFPLTTIHKNAYRDSLAALCAHEQGQYMPYKKALYALEETKRGATVSDSDRIGALQGIQIDTAKFSQCLANDTYKSRVDQDMADGNALQVNATPTIVLDGVKLDMSIFRSEEMFANYMSGYVNR